MNKFYLRSHTRAFVRKFDVVEEYVYKVGFVKRVIISACYYDGNGSLLIFCHLNKSSIEDARKYWVNLVSKGWIQINI